MRIYCRNCSRHGEDLNSCPRCGEAHAEFLRRNFSGERRYERELEQQGREALTEQQQRAEEMCRRQFLAEQEWRAHREALARAQQMPPQHHVAVVHPGHAQVQMGARATPATTLETAAELVEGLRAIPAEERGVVFRAMREALNRR